MGSLLTSKIQRMNALEHAKQLFIDSLDLFAQGKFELAESALLKAHQIAPDRLSILVNLVAVQLKLEKFQEAYKFAQLSVAIDSTQPEAFLNLGISAKAMGLTDEAIKHFDQALTLKPDQEQAWFHKGLAHVSCKQYTQAQSCFEKVVLISPEHFDAIFSLASVSNKLKQHERAIEFFTQALVSDEHKTRAIQNLIVIYGDLNQPKPLENLIEQHHRLIEGNSLCNELLGFSYFNANNLQLANHYFKQAALLSENNPNVNNPLDWPISEPRLRHDFEQLCLLEARGLATTKSHQALNVLKQYEQLIKDKSQKITGKSAQDNEALINAIGGYHHLPTPQFSAPALGKNDYAQIEHTFMHSSSKLVVIDNFLSDEALRALRAYCEEATIWKRTYPNGYLGSFMASGFGSPIILEIARQLKAAMPNVVGNEPLRQAWGFKYDQRMTGINLHADFARVNINFWLTPDDACLDDTTGGLVVYDMPPPDDWSFEEANYNSQKIKDYLDSKHAKMIRVPYKMNRCILFDSTYFHATDDIHFKAGYENRRVNCTLLFGDGL
jgi:tetratricopeptide (TPR) repeat protein